MRTGYSYWIFHSWSNIDPGRNAKKFKPVAFVRMDMSDSLSFGDLQFRFGNRLANNAVLLVVALLALLALATGTGAAEIGDTLVGTHGSDASGSTGP